MSTEATLKESYGAMFERAVIKCLLTRRDFALATASTIKKQFFEEAANVAIIEAHATCHAQLKRIPSLPIVHAHLTAKATKQKGAALETTTRAIELLDDAQQTAISDSDADYVKLKYGEFVARATMRVALIEAVEQFEGGDVDAAIACVVKARDSKAFASDDADRCIDLFDTRAVFRRYVRKKKAAGNCPYGVPTLDACMRGGIEEGCLGIFMAPPKRGKTRALVQAGANALLHGNKVLHVTLELSADDVALRYHARLTGVPINEIFDKPKTYAPKADAMRQKMEALGGALHIRQWAMGEASALDISSHLHRVQDQIGAKIDMLIVDYVDHMRPAAGTGDARWERHGQMAKDLKNLAVVERVRLWSASQTVKGSFSKPIISIEDGADSMEKVRVSDIIVALCQTYAEKKQGRMRLALLGNRLGGNEGKIVNCLASDATQLIQEHFARSAVDEAEDNDEEGGL